MTRTDIEHLGDSPVRSGSLSPAFAELGDASLSNELRRQGWPGK